MSILPSARHTELEDTASPPGEPSELGRGASLLCCRTNRAVLRRGSPARPSSMLSTFNTQENTHTHTLAGWDLLPGVRKLPKRATATGLSCEFCPATQSQELRLCSTGSSQTALGRGDSGPGRDRQQGWEQGSPGSFVLCRKKQGSWGTNGFVALEQGDHGRRPHSGGQT